MNIRCPHCGRDNPDYARFCMHCSGQLAQTCPNCGVALSLKAQFCSRCGTAVPAAPSGGAALGAGTGRLPPATLLATRYRIMQKLGQGGMGAVYLAEDTRLSGKYWAIKEMSDAALTDPMQRQAAVQAFRQEAEMLAKLDHVNLPRVSDYFSEGSNQYLVMEYVQGQTLEAKLLQANGPLPASQVILWAEKLCSVLTYLHNQQPPIIFRDLKPGNIMLRADGEVKLIDFGIARHFKPGQHKDTQAFGTMGYAPPEQHGKGQTDVRSDIYSLGATLHHLLTGRDPSLTPFMFERARKLNPAISQSLDEAIAKAVEIEPVKRWQSMAELRQTISATAGRIPKSPPLPVASSSKAGSGSGWRRGCLVLGIGSIVMIGLVALWVNLPAGRATQPTPQPTATRQPAATVTAVAQIQAAQSRLEDLKLLAHELVSPADGTLIHDPVDGLIENEEISERLQDFGLQVWFYNPYAASEGKWDYGIGFRQAESGQQYRLVVFSDRSWTLDLRDDKGDSMQIAQGDIGTLDSAPGRANLLELWVSAGTGYFLVNREYVATLDVSAHNTAGTLWIGTGFLEGNELADKSTRYEDFTVWALADTPATATAVVEATATAIAAIPIATAAAQEQAATLATNILKTQTTPVADPIDGELVHDPASGMIKSYTIVEELHNFVAEARFYNPYRRTENAWDYGFGFRHTDSNQQYRLVVQSDGLWNLYLHEGGVDAAPLASGTISNLDVTPDGSNLLQLWVDDEEAYFFVNQTYIATLDVSGKDTAGTVWIGTGMLVDHEQSGATTRYEDFAVWSLPE